MWSVMVAIAFGLLVCVSPMQAEAKVSGFVVWQPEPQGPSYLLPKIVGETSQQTAERWLQAVKKSSAYGRMEDAQALTLSTDPSRFSELPPSTSEHPRVAVILNRPKQMMPRNRYLSTVVSAFEKHGPNLFAVPIGLETILSSSEISQVRKQLNGFDGQLGVGGDDTHPRMWKQHDLALTEGDVNWRRDVHQSAYMREYLRNGKGRVFYICGSMQRAAVTAGFGLHTDISHLTSRPQREGAIPIMLEVVADPGSELSFAAGAERFETSNYHHAAVNPDFRYRDTVDASITGYNIEPDGSRGRVVKAIEFPGNAGFATQFHPEFEGSEAERRIVQYVATGWKLRGRYAPKVIVDCLAERLMGLMPQTPKLPGYFGKSASQ